MFVQIRLQSSPKFSLASPEGGDAFFVRDGPGRKSGEEDLKKSDEKLTAPHRKKVEETQPNTTHASDASQCQHAQAYTTNRTASCKG